MTARRSSRMSEQRVKQPNQMWLIKCTPDCQLIVRSAKMQNVQRFATSTTNLSIFHSNSYECSASAWKCTFYEWNCTRCERTTHPLSEMLMSEFPLNRRGDAGEVPLFDFVYVYCSYILLWSHFLYRNFFPLTAFKCSC